MAKRIKVFQCFQCKKYYKQSKIKEVDLIPANREFNAKMCIFCLGDNDDNEPQDLKDLINSGKAKVIT